MLTFVLYFPLIGAADVVRRILDITIGSGETETFEIEPDQTESNEFTGEDGDVVYGTLVDIDDAGNKSEPSEFSFVLRDTIAPPKPGPITPIIIREN